MRANASYYWYSWASSHAARSCASVAKAMPALAASMMTSATAGLVLAPEEGSVNGVSNEVKLFPEGLPEAVTVFKQQSHKLIDIIRAGSAHPESGDRCTSSNKHRVLGALALMQALQTSIPITVVLVPSSFTTLFLCMIMVQSYSLAEVKIQANKFLFEFGALLSKSQVVASSTSDPELIAVKELFLSKLSSGSLHWRAAVLAHAWLAMISPISDDIESAKQSAKTQLSEIVKTEMLLAKDVAMSGLTIALDAYNAEGGDQSYKSEVIGCIQATVTDPEWVKKLIGTINDLHTCLYGSASKSSALALRSTPELGLRSTLRLSSQRVQAAVGGLHFFREPAGAPKEVSAPQAAAKAEPDMRLAYFLALLFKVAPNVLAMCRDPITTFEQATAEKQALEPNMEWVTLEVFHAAVASGVAWKEGPDGSCAWSEWLWGTIVGRYERLTLDGSGIAVRIIAHALRAVANQATESAGAFVEGLQCMTDAVCKLVDSWTGTSAGDCKHVLLLSYSIDMLVQLSTSAAGSVISDSLSKLLAQGQCIVDKCKDHALQPVRGLTGKLWTVLLAAAAWQSPQSHQEINSGSHLQEELLADARRIYDDAAVAVVAAAEVSSATACSQNGHASVQDAACEPQQWERVIGTATAMTSQLAFTRLIIPGIESIGLVAVPWAIQAQSIQNAQMHGLFNSIRRLITDLKNFMLEGVILFAAASLARSFSFPFLHQLLVHFISDEYRESVSLDENQNRLSLYTPHTALFDADLRRVMDACLSCIKDEKLEIRILAGSTISGLIRVLPSHIFADVKKQIVDEAQSMFPRGRHKPQTSATQIQRHACVLKLAALLQSHPYNVPDWMDPVLVLISRAARYPPPVRTSATQALGEFKKTQATTESSPLKDRLKPDVWESIREVGESSYFA